MATGKIKNWIGDRGFGFIADDGGGPDVFLHTNEVPQGDRELLKVGTVINFEIRKTPKGLAAHNVRLQVSTLDPSSDEPHEHFHNPYAFVPSPPRQKAIQEGGFAGDFDPLKCGLDHASLKPNLWTGHIPIKLTTVTPLVLLKTDGEDRDTTQHQTYDVLDYLPESSLRGMLWSTYEVVTNSRYGCFSNSDRLAYRMRPQEALDLIPAIIENGTGPSGLAARLYTGTSTPTTQRPNGPMYAAMLTLYHAHPTTCHGGIPKTGEVVNAEIVRHRHRRGYFFWKAIQVCPLTASLTPSGAPSAKFITGSVFITNQNMRNKHDERIFFNPQSNAFDITNGVKDAWRMRIQSYREAHSDNEIFGRPGAHNQPWKKIGNNPGDTAWSPHQYQDSEHRSVWRKDPHGRATTHDALELQPGDMVYARCEFDSAGNIIDVTDLFPVMISRELYANSPAGLLDSSLKPASSRKKLSPADRLFGWVPQGQGSDEGYKSRIRVVCEESPRPEIVERFNGGNLPLTILGQPKPAQGRFYVADDQGGPQHKVDKTDAGYDASQGKSLRGRKQYWHHAGLEAHQQAYPPAKDYWHPSVEDRTQVKRDGRYQEYRRPNKNGQQQKDPQNRSIKGWIKPDTKFKVSLYVQNLQPEEVGALLWLLSLPKGHYFKLGYGKPLGFGSVRLEVDNGVLPLGTGDDWKKYYATLDMAPPATLDEQQRNQCIQAFQASLEAAYNTNLSFDDLPFITDFLQILKGPIDDSPIHYPRLDRKPTPEGENFRWFTENEQNFQDALPDVTDSEGLPYEPYNA